MMAPEPSEGGAGIHQALARACSSASQLSKANGEGAVNLRPGNTPEQAVTHFRGQVL
jgi:hypothetical protein